MHKIKKPSVWHLFPCAMSACPLSVSMLCSFTDISWDRLDFDWQATAFVYWYFSTKHSHGIKGCYWILTKSNDIYTLSTPHYVPMPLSSSTPWHPFSTEGIRAVSFTEMLHYFFESLFLVVEPDGENMAIWSHCLLHITNLRWCTSQKKTYTLTHWCKNA